MKSSMDVEVVDIRKVMGEGKLKAFANVKIGGCLIIRGFCVMQGPRGVFVAMPSKPSKEGKWFDVVSTLDDNLKRSFEEKILEAYDLETDGVAA